MSALSMSFTLGKVSTGSANLEHNNREFFADNVDVTRIKDNIIYANQDVREAYDELFGDALDAYNAKQKQPCRRIHDYYEHIFEGSREEAFYELVIQFGDMKTAGVGSENGEIAKKMLDDYMRGFKARNKNLHIFSGNLHMDEASPHLHINFIPFYTEGRKNGLSKGVSMKAALIEQGFKPKSQTQNQLYLWQESEKAEMEELLRRYNFKRDIKDADYAHQSVPDYKESQDAKRLRELMQIGVPRNEINAENVDRLKRENSLLEIEKEKATAREHSPYKSFYFSDRNKQSFMVAELERLQIPFRETDNGLEAKECYVKEIRKIEKTFKSPSTSFRDDLRDKIDMFVLQSKDFNEVLRKLSDSDYKIKHGKYISFLPKHSSQYIRLKSLGEEYSEQAIRNRLFDKYKFENDNLSKYHALKNKDSLEGITRKTIRQYTVVFVKGLLPMHKIRKGKPFSWENCEQLDRLSELNRKLNAGATITDLHNDLERFNKSIPEIEDKFNKLKVELNLFRDLYNAGVRYFEQGGVNQADIDLLDKHEITITSYKRITKLIADDEAEIFELKSLLDEERINRRKTSEMLVVIDKVMATTYVNSLVEAEKHRRQSDLLKNGLKSADAGSGELKRVDKIIKEATKEHRVKLTESPKTQPKEPEKPAQTIYTGRKK
ncbi:MAG: plasmid recombination protein [Oscillospiraceae bacterium]|nr:plasmid recombination protein [Oscillospiraceae bacterium]